MPHLKPTDILKRVSRGRVSIQLVSGMGPGPLAGHAWQGSDGRSVPGPGGIRRAGRRVGVGGLLGLHLTELTLAESPNLRVGLTKETGPLIGQMGTWAPQSTPPVVMLWGAAFVSDAGTLLAARLNGR